MCIGGPYADTAPFYIREPIPPQLQKDGCT
jgi:hypothetical protein